MICQLVCKWDEEEFTQAVNAHVKLLINEGYNHIDFKYSTCIDKEEFGRILFSVLILGVKK